MSTTTNQAATSRALRRTSALLAAILLLLVESFAGAEAPREPLVAALVPSRALADDARVALLDARLAALAGTRWLDRREVARLFDEQSLAAAAAGAGTADRLRLGRLARADVLLLLDRLPPADDAPDATPAALRLTVVQSDTGLRLLQQPVALSDAADAADAADADAVARLAAEAFERNRVPVRHVAAVPPFESGNLSRADDHLKGALARVLADAVSARPGVLAVELAEADAIGRELARSDGPAAVARLRPLYAAGRFSRELDGRLTVRLAWHREGGAEPPAETTRTFDTAAHAADFLREVAASPELFPDAAEATPTDPAAEADRLAARARSFAAVGDWGEALDLTEAALLLDDDAAARRAAARYAGHHWSQAFDADRAANVEYREVNVDRRAALHWRAWEHAAAWSRAEAVPRETDVNLFLSAGEDPERAAAFRRDLTDIYRMKARRDERDVWFEGLDSLLPIAFRAALNAEFRRTRGRGSDAAWQWLAGTPAAADFCVDVAAQLADTPTATAEDFLRLTTGLSAGAFPGLPDTPQVRHVVAAISGLDSPAAREAGAEMRRRPVDAAVARRPPGGAGKVGHQPPPQPQPPLLPPSLPPPLPLPPPLSPAPPSAGGVGVGVSPGRPLPPSFGPGLAVSPSASITCNSLARFNRDRSVRPPAAAAAAAAP